MKKSKTMLLKTMCIAMVIVLSASFLAGCGKKSDKNENGQTIVSVGGWPSVKGTALDMIEKRKSEFEKANPDVVIEPDMWGFDRKTFYAKAAGDQLPIVYQAGFTEMAEIINSEFAADLTDVLEKRGFADMLNPKVKEALSKDGRIYALPKTVSVLGIAYNTELFEAAGLTEADGTPKQPKDWNEFVEFAVQIKEKTGKPGIVLPTSKHGGWFFTILGWGFGVDFMEKDENGKWQAMFNSPEAVAALQWVKDLRWKYDVVPAQSLVTGDQWWEIFGLGNGAMTFGGPGMVTNSVVRYGMTPNQLGMFGMPAGPKRNVTQISGEIWCISNVATEDQIDAGVRWLEGTVNYKLTDEFKASKEGEMQTMLEANRMVGVKEINLWNENSETYKFEHELISANINTNPNYVKLYNDYVANCPAEIQAEEPVCCQELYETLANCIQEVFTNKDADCAELLKKANSDFQANYLDNITY